MTPDFAEGLAIMLKLAGIAEPVKEHKFHPKRKWRLDLAWPEEKLAVEIEGGAVDADLVLELEELRHRLN
mgnify:CR=1 FL=1